MNGWPIFCLPLKEMVNKRVPNASLERPYAAVPIEIGFIQALDPALSGLDGALRQQDNGGTLMSLKIVIE